MNGCERKLAALKRNLGKKQFDRRTKAMFEATTRVMIDARLRECGPQTGALTAKEQDVADELFRHVFPDLVRLHPGGELGRATAETVASLRAGLLALRGDTAAGDACACLDGKTRWGMSNDLFAPTDSAGLCQRCGRIRRAPRSEHPSDPGMHS